MLGPVHVHGNVHINAHVFFSKDLFTAKRKKTQRTKILIEIHWQKKSELVGRISLYLPDRLRTKLADIVRTGFSKSHINSTIVAKNTDRCKQNERFSADKIRI